MNAPIVPGDDVHYSPLLDLYRQLFEDSDGDYFLACWSYSRSFFLVEELFLSEDEDMQLSVSEEEGSVVVEESLSEDEDMELSSSEDSLQPVFPEDEDMELSLSEGEQEDELSFHEDEDMLVSSEEEEDDLPDFYLIPSFEPEPSKTPNDTRRFIRVIAHDVPNEPARHVRWWVPRARSMRPQNYPTLSAGHPWEQFNFYSVAHKTYKRIDLAEFVDMIGRARIFLCVRRDLLRAECPEIDRWENIAEIWAKLLDEPFVDGDGSSTDPYVIYD
ncbi:hypothetical protein B0H13DRAFT_1865580 [Mycena leptocephala]|nr:hypothetical protein B0H13DRAFT_1865580 [Mycena leptocephala]